MLTVTKLANRLGLNPSRIRALISSGKIKATKIGKTWVITDYSKALDRKNGRPAKIPKIPKICYLIGASAPVLAYLYTLLFKYQGF